MGYWNLEFKKSIGNKGLNRHIRQTHESQKIVVN